MPNPEQPYFVAAILISSAVSFITLISTVVQTYNYTLDKTRISIAFMVCHFGAILVILASILKYFQIVESTILTVVLNSLIMVLSVVQVLAFGRFLEYFTPLSSSLTVSRVRAMQGVILMIGIVGTFPYIIEGLVFDVNKDKGILSLWYIYGIAIGSSILNVYYLVVSIFIAVVVRNYFTTKITRLSDQESMKKKLWLLYFQIFLLVLIFGICFQLSSMASKFRSQNDGSDKRIHQYLIVSLIITGQLIVPGLPWIFKTIMGLQVLQQYSTDYLGDYTSSKLGLGNSALKGHQNTPISGTKGM